MALKAARARSMSEPTVVSFSLGDHSLTAARTAIQQPPAKSARVLRAQWLGTLVAAQPGEKSADPTSTRPSRGMLQQVSLDPRDSRSSLTSSSSDDCLSPESCSRTGSTGVDDARLLDDFKEDEDMIFSFDEESKGIVETQWTQDHLPELGDVFSFEMETNDQGMADTQTTN